jgi:hypothetical protein
MTTQWSRRLHLALTIIWLVAVVPTMLWWRDSILWVAFMSLWANVASHWASYQAVRAEERVEEMDPKV